MYKNIEKIFLLSDAQKGILYQHLASGSDIYTEVICLKLHSEPDLAFLKSSWQKVLDNNQILRSYIQWERVSNPLLVIERNKIVTIETAQNYADINEAIREERVKGVQIDKEAMRIVVYSNGTDNTFMILITHHIFLDGWSTGIVLDEWYQSFHNRDIFKTLDYDAYLQYLKQKETSRSEQFWNQQLQHYNGLMSFPRTHGASIDRELSRPIPDSMCNSISKAVEQYGITVSSLFLAVWSAFLSQYNYPYVDFGVAASGRQFGNMDFNKVVGLFINVYPFHISVDRKMSVEQWIQQVNNIQSVSLQNADIPFPTIKSRINKNIHEFNTLLVVENYPVNQQIGEDVQIYKVSEDTHYDLVIQIHLYDRWHIKMISGETGKANLPYIMDCFFNLLNLFTSAGPTINLCSLCKSQYVSMLVYTPFDSAYLQENISRWVYETGHNYKLSCKDVRLLDMREDTGEKAVSNIFVGLEYMLVGITDFQHTDRVLSDFIKRLEQYFKVKTDHTIFLYSLHGLFIYGTSDERSQLFDSYYTHIEQMSAQYSHVTFLKIIDMPEFGKGRDIFDPVAFDQANIPFQKDVFRDLAMIVCRKSWAAFSNEFKLLILDCDNTLWKGICAEDGLEGINVTEAYAQFQQFLLNKKNEGFLLALCSKNQEDDVKRIFQKSPEMLLSYDDFIIRKINWENKADNISNICCELRLDESSVIFMDDSVTECIICLKKLPRVLTLLLPLEEQNLMPFISRIWAFDRIKVTNEDKNRHNMYLENRQREKLREMCTNDGELLKYLNMEIQLSPLNQMDRDRISQLSFRTNQCNLNGIRLSVHELMNQGSDESFVIRLTDIYGSYGIVGYLRYHVDEQTLHIRHFFLSCRALSRYVEHKILNYLLDFFENKKIQTCDMQCIITEKNDYFVQFLKNTKWSIQQEGNILHCSRSTFQRIDFSFEEFVTVRWTSEDDGPNTLDTVGFAAPMRDSGTEHSVDISETEQKSFLCHWKQNILELAKEGKTYDFLWPLIYCESPCCENIEYIKEIQSETTLAQRLKTVWEKILERELNIPTDDFFASGGNSLQVLELASHIYREFGCLVSLSDILKGPTFYEIELLIHHMLNQDSRKLPSATNKREYSMPVFTQRIFSAHQSEAGTMYNMPFAFEIKGALDNCKLEKTFHTIVNHNRIFRSRFTMKDTEPIVIITEDIDFHVESVECDKPTAEIDIQKLVRPFHTEEGSLLCVKLIKTDDDNTNIIFIDFDHLIMDAHSLVMIIEQFKTIYVDENTNFPDIDYYDYSEWFNRNREDPQQDKEYWLKQLAGSTFALHFPQSSKRKKEHGLSKECRVDFELDQELVERMKKAATDCSVSLYAFMTACYYIFLYWITGCRDINIGTPVDMRDSPISNKIPGMMVNTLVIREHIEENESYVYFVQRIFQTIKEMIAHKDCMYQDIVQAINHNEAHTYVRDLYNTMFVFQEFDFPELELPDCIVRRLPVYPGMAQNTLIWECITTNNNFQCNMMYDNTVFSRDTVQGYARQLVDIITEVCCNIHKTIAHFQCLYQPDFEKIRKFEQGSIREHSPQMLHRLFEEQVLLRPNAPCLITNKQIYSYEQVNQAANGVAYQLSNYVKPGACVMVDCGNHLFEIIVYMLAILKSQCVYLPIGMDMPLERKKAIIKDCSVQLILAKDDDDRQDVPVFYPDLIMRTGCTNLEFALNPQSTAYIIYTSGTTGNSKGVQISHTSIVNTIYSRREEYNLSDRDTTMLLMMPQFDGFMTSVFTPLVSGARLVLPDSLYDIEQVTNNLVRHRVTHFIATPTMYRALLECPDMMQANALQTVVLAGESISPTLVEDSHHLLPDVEIVNEYGPTENSVLSTVKRCVTVDDITVGKPISNVRVRIVDEHEQLCLIGVTGELCLSGKGLSEGYISDLAMTRMKFVEGLCGDNLRWYKTGDLAYWREDGEIVLSGRNDQQIKYRGYRLDLLEIRNAANAVPDVNDCCIVHEKKTDQLLCYYIANRFIPRHVFVQTLRKILPIYMLPNDYIRISRFPTNSNGKLDEKKLIDCVIMSPLVDSMAEKTSQMILELFKVILHRDDLKVKDSFFAVGGTSLKAIVLLDRIKEQWNIDIGIVDIFTYPTAENLGSWIDSRECKEPVSVARRTKAILLDEKTTRLNCQYSQKTEVPLSDIFIAMAYFAFFNIDKKNEFSVCIHRGDAWYKLIYDFQQDVEVNEYINIIRHTLNTEKPIKEFNSIKKKNTIIISYLPVFGQDFDALPILIYSQQTETSCRIVIEYSPESLCDEAAENFLDMLTNFYMSL